MIITRKEYLIIRQSPRGMEIQLNFNRRIWLPLSVIVINQSGDLIIPDWLWDKKVNELFGGE
jgi:hypothetical protein